MRLEEEARRLQGQISAFSGTHSGRTYNAGNPAIDPWLRNVLVQLQATLNALGEQQKNLARQVDQNTEHLQLVINALNSKR